MEECKDKKILIVDDSATVRLYLTQTMEQWGNHVLSAQDGTSAVQAWKSNRPLDLILLDIFLPDTTGIDVLKTIRAEDNQTAIVMITAHGNVDSAIEAVRLGADGYIEKAAINSPEAQQEFVHKLSRAIEIRAIVLERKQLEAAIRRQNSELRQMNDDLLAARQSLLSEKNRLRDILFSLSEAVIVVDTREKIVLMNREAETHLDIKERNAVNQPLSQYEINPELLAMVKQTLSQGNKTRREITAPRLSYDLQRVFSCSTVPLRDHTGQTNGAVITLNDITQEKELAQMKQDFYSMITHDLRNPLSSILGFADLIYSGDLGDLNEEQKEVVGIIKNSGQKLLELVNDFLDYSSIEAGFLDIHKERVDLRNIIQKVPKEMAPLAQEKGHHIEVILPDEAAIAFIDVKRIERVLTNLYSNAIKYTPDGGHITLRLEERTGEYVISVQDSGIGISGESQSFLFQRYRRVKSDKTRHILGTGLGLLISKEIVEAHGGRIGVESKPEQGSTFFFTIPKMED